MDTVVLNESPVAPESPPPPPPQPAIVEVPVTDPNLTAAQMRSAARDIVETKLEEVSEQTNILHRVEAIEATVTRNQELLASLETASAAIIGLLEAMTAALITEEAQEEQAELIAETTKEAIKPRKNFLL